MFEIGRESGFTKEEKHMVIIRIQDKVLRTEFKQK